jgi:hypothetical protein
MLEPKLNYIGRLLYPIKCFIFNIVIITVLFIISLFSRYCFPVLCVNEPILSDNGIYVVRAGAWDRTFPKEEGRPNVYIELGTTHQFEWWHAHEEDWSTGSSTWEKT